MTALDRLEALLAAHDGNAMAFVGELNVLANAALPALVRVAKLAKLLRETRDIVVEAELDDALVELEAVRVW